MGFIKRGHGDVIPEPEEQHTAAKGDWTEDDEAELAQENVSADTDDEEG